MADVVVLKSDGKSAWAERIVDLGEGTHAAQVVRGALMVGPLSQGTVDAWEDVAGSTLDTLHMSVISFTIVNTHGANALNWQPVGSNDLSWTAPVLVDGPNMLAAGDSGIYANDTTVFRYYKVQVQSAVAGSHASATIVGLAKA